MRDEETRRPPEELAVLVALDPLGVRRDWRLSSSESESETYDMREGRGAEPGGCVFVRWARLDFPRGVLGSGLCRRVSRSAGLVGVMVGVMVGVLPGLVAGCVTSCVAGCVASSGEAISFAEVRLPGVSSLRVGWS